MNCRRDVRGRQGVHHGKSVTGLHVSQGQRPRWAPAPETWVSPCTHLSGYICVPPPTETRILQKRKPRLPSKGPDAPDSRVSLQPLTSEQNPL